MAGRAGIDRGLAEAGVAVSGSVRDTGGSIGVGEKVEEAVGAGLGGKDTGERLNGEEGDDRTVGVQVGSSVDGRKGVLSKCLRDISRPVIRWPRPGADWVAVGIPCSDVFPGAQWV